MSDTDPTDDRGSRPRVRLLVGIAAAVLVLGAALAWFLFLRDDSPAAFDIDDATSNVDRTAAPGTNGEEPDPAGTVDGTWIIDPRADSEAGFRVDEELASIGAATAVGRTQDVEGTLTIDGTTVSDVEITVDVTSLQTDDRRRDRRMREALAADEFPTAVFVTTEAITFDEIPAEGETIRVTAPGEMTIKGATNPVEVALDARLVDDVLVVVGSLQVVFSDYGVEAPTSPIALSVEDNGFVEFQLFFRRS